MRVQHLVALAVSCFSMTATAAITASQLRALTSCAQSSLNPTNAPVAGRVIGPSNQYYTDARIGPLVNPEYPALLAYAMDAKEVQNLVKCARSVGVKAVPRSGGHHFESWSALNDTLTIDMAHIDYVNVASTKQTATVGAGIRLGALYINLSKAGKSFPGGICPTVGLGGFISVGGYGMTMRALGMSTDYVLSAKVVTADGNLVTASPSSNPDLFWAIRGGGTYGIIVEATLQLVDLPRSSMVSIYFPLKETRYDVAKIYMDWAPKQIGNFNSQLNVYSDHMQFVGWYLGGTLQQVQDLINQSGFLNIPGVEPHLSANCSSENSRMFWMYNTDECVPDDQARASYVQYFNVLQHPFVSLDGYPHYQLLETPPSPSEPTAQPWPRLDLINKTYFILKNRTLTDEELREIIQRTGDLPAEAAYWAEWTTFNTPGPAKTDKAFTWEKDAYVLMRQAVSVGTTPAENAAYNKFQKDFDDYILPRIGDASYAGFMDGKTGSTSPLKSYYGTNICRLVKVKKQYDPTNFFSNPFSIPTSAAGIPGVKC